MNRGTPQPRIAQGLASAEENLIPLAGIAPSSDAQGGDSGISENVTEIRRAGVGGFYLGELTPIPTLILLK